MLNSLKASNTILFVNDALVPFWIMQGLLAQWDSFPSKVTCKSRSVGVFWSIWRVPIKSNFVLSGLIRRLFWQHHAATFLRSSVICRAAPSISLTKNDKYNLVNVNRCQKQYCSLKLESFSDSFESFDAETIFV